MTARASTRRLLATLAVAAALPASAVADDFYVDPLQGSNGASGTSSATAWRTLRHALAETNGPVAHTLHLLPGVHADPAALTMTDSLTLVGEEGAGVTFLRPDRLRVVPSGGAVARRTLVGLTVRNATRGVEAVAPLINTSVTVRLEDVRFESCSIAIAADVSTGRRAVIEGTRVVIDFAAIGIRIEGNVSLTLEESTVVDTVFRGIDALNLRGTPAAPAALVLLRSRVMGTAGQAVLVGGTAVNVRIEDCLVADNGTEGVHAQFLSGSLDIRRSTIARNGNFGLLIQAGSLVATVEDSVVATSGIRDVTVGGTTLDIRDTLVGDASASGPGVISGDPQFVGPSTGDFRLRPASPAVDRLPASTVPDVDGLPRNVDGDLDRVPARDLGAIELRPFLTRSPALAGEPLILEILGPDFGHATVAFSPVPLASQPAASPYGMLALDPTVAWRALHITVPGSGSPVTTSLMLPLASAGETWGLQTLIWSSASATGAAFSNAIEIAIQ